MAALKYTHSVLILLGFVASTSLISSSSAPCRRRYFTRPTEPNSLEAIDKWQHEVRKSAALSTGSLHPVAFINSVITPRKSKSIVTRSKRGVSTGVPISSTISRLDSLSKYKRRSRLTTSLCGTVNFRGVASAKLTGERDGSGNMSSTSLKEFLLTSASDSVLLGMKNSGNDSGISHCTRIEGSDYASKNAELWECRQASIEWFGLTLVPVFVNEIERSITSSTRNGGSVVISIIDAKTEVQRGGTFGNTLASAMKRSVFEGRNVVRWEEHSTNANDQDDGTSKQKYTLEGNIKLSLTIKLPPLIPLPPGFNAIGSKIVERTCRDRLRRNLEDISSAYLQWANSKDV